jgi:exosortase J
MVEMGGTDAKLALEMPAAAPESASNHPQVGRPTAHLVLCLAAAFLSLGVLAASLLWPIWTGDATRSLGIYIPLVSIALILRAWRHARWEMRGTWWGVAPLLFAVLISRDGGNALQAFFVLPGERALTLLPLGLAVCSYGCGIVLLLGGFRVWRKTLFPVALLMLVNPVPTPFAKIDLPLQYLCAHTARAFAAAIGVHPSGSQLTLMFTPGFGMFIAPGCNGLRGAVTLAYIALIVGYLYRFSLNARSLSVLASIGLGYLFNLLRLCALVLFYRLGMRFEGLQQWATAVDYLIGGSLFFVAAILFARVVAWKKHRPEIDGDPENSCGPGHLMYWKGLVLAGVAIVAVVSCAPNLRAVARQRTEPYASIANVLPNRIGNFRLLRTWSERDWLNQVVYRWGAYSPAAGENEIDLGFWVGPGIHHPLACHLASGEQPSWHEIDRLPATPERSNSFQLDFYPDSGTLEASTVCSASGCGENVHLPPAEGGFTFASMGLHNFLVFPRVKPLPVIIRMQNFALIPPAERTRERMLLQMQSFISSVNAQDWTRFAKAAR